MGHAGGGRAELLLSVEEVANHSTAEDCWIILRGNQVFDVTDFADVHPGGRKMLTSYAGKDATAVFEQLHSQAVFESVASKYYIGTVGELITAPSKSMAAPIQVDIDAGLQPPADGLGTAAADVSPAPEPAERLNWRIESPFPSNAFDDSGLEAGGRVHTARRRRC